MFLQSWVFSGYCKKNKKKQILCKGIPKFGKMYSRSLIMIYLFKYLIIMYSSYVLHELILNLWTIPLTLASNKWTIVPSYIFSPLDAKSSGVEYTFNFCSASNRCPFFAFFVCGILNIRNVQVSIKIVILILIKLLTLRMNLFDFGKDLKLISMKEFFLP